MLQIHRGRSTTRLQWCLKIMKNSHQQKKHGPTTIVHRLFSVAASGSTCLRGEKKTIKNWKELTRDDMSNMKNATVNRLNQLLKDTDRTLLKAQTEKMQHLYDKFVTSYQNFIRNSTSGEMKKEMMQDYRAIVDFHDFELHIKKPMVLGQEEWDELNCVLAQYHETPEMRRNFELFSMTILMMARALAQDLIRQADLEPIYSYASVIDNIHHLQLSPTLPSQFEDESYYLCGMVDSLLYISSLIPVGTRESLIGTAYFMLLLQRFSCDSTVAGDGSGSSYEEKQVFAQQLLEKYEKTKLYYTANTNGGGKMMTEDEFDWFEDLESGLSIHLGCFIRALHASAVINLQSQKKLKSSGATVSNSELELDDSLKSQDDMDQIINESIYHNPTNPYLYYLKTVSMCKVGFLFENPKNHLKVAEQYMKVAFSLVAEDSSKLHLNSNIEKKVYGKSKPVPRVPDLKYFPLHEGIQAIHFFEALSIRKNTGEDLKLLAFKIAQNYRHMEQYSRVPLGFFALSALFKGLFKKDEELFFDYCIAFLWFPQARFDSKFGSLLYSSALYLVKNGRFEEWLSIDKQYQIPDFEHPTFFMAKLDCEIGLNLPQLLNNRQELERRLKLCDDFIKKKANDNQVLLEDLKKRRQIIQEKLLAI